MTLEEAIWREEALAHSFKKMTKSIKTQEQLAEEHRHLAEWLKELKYYKDRQDLINKSWQELIGYKEGIEKIKMRIQAYRERGETVLASGMEQALDIFEEVNADANSD